MESLASRHCWLADRRARSELRVWRSAAVESLLRCVKPSQAEKQQEPDVTLMRFSWLKKINDPRFRQDDAVPILTRSVTIRQNANIQFNVANNSAHLKQV
jgi:hypothetical protein